MAYLNAINVIALLFIILGLIKITVISINKRSWLRVSKAIYSNHRASSFIFVVLALLIFIFLLQQFSIVEIFSIMAFTSILLALGLLQYSKDLLHLLNKAAGKKFSSFQIIFVILWFILSIWALIEIFF